MGGDTMSEKRPVSAAQKAATKRWEDKRYDKILLRLQKDSITSKESIQAHAEKLGESINGYITKAIEARISAQDNAVPEPIEEAPPAPELSEDISVLDLSVKTFNYVCRAGVRTVAELEAWVHSDQCCLNPERSPGYKEILAALETYKENTSK